jgi:hypothetical protein
VGEFLCNDFYIFHNLVFSVPHIVQPASSVDLIDGSYLADKHHNHDRKRTSGNKNEKFSDVLPWFIGTASRGGQGVWLFS